MLSQRDRDVRSGSMLLSPGKCAGLCQAERISAVSRPESELGRREELDPDRCPGELLLVDIALLELEGPSRFGKTNRTRKSVTCFPGAIERRVLLEDFLQFSDGTRRAGRAGGVADRKKRYHCHTSNGADDFPHRNLLICCSGCMQELPFGILSCFLKM